MRVGVWGNYIRAYVALENHHPQSIQTPYLIWATLGGKEIDL